MDNNFILQTIFGIIVGVLTSVCASFIFMGYSEKFRVSKIKISDKCCIKNHETENEKFIIIKIINFSKRPIYNIKYKTFIQTTWLHENKNSINSHIKALSNLKIEPNHIQGKINDVLNLNALQLFLDYNIELADNEELIFSI